jgi:hypothetical protein
MQFRESADTHFLLCGPSWRSNYTKHKTSASVFLGRLPFCYPLFHKCDHFRVHALNLRRLFVRIAQTILQW